MENIYFKDVEHKEQMNLVLKSLNKSNMLDDIEYGSFAYVVGAVYKGKQLEKGITEDGIDLDYIYEKIKVFSHSEQVMLKFALQCFNGSIDDIKLSDVMRPLDQYNTKVIKQVIDIRY